MIDDLKFFRDLRQGRNMFFVHIPKTAGSTLVEHFRKHLPNKSEFYYTKEKRQFFESSDLTKRDRSIRVSGGHYSLSHVIEGGYPNAIFLSFVRHPVDRVISFYKFTRRNGFQEPTSEAARNHDFPGWLNWLKENRYRILNNQQCRFLATTSKESEAVNIKFENLGFMEPDLPLFLSRMERCTNITKRIAKNLGKGDIDPENHKVSKSREEFYVPPTCIDMIKEHNQEDFKLYESVYKTSARS